MHFDDGLRAGCGTKTATDAKAEVNMSEAVYDVDGILRADGGTVAVSDTAVSAVAGATEVEFCREATFNARIAITRFHCVAVTVAMDDGNLRYDICRFFSEKRGNRGGDLVSAGNT